MKRIFWRDEKGAATVEFALVAILFLVIVFGIIEFGILMFDKHILTNASREGARAGVVMRMPRVPDVEIQNIVRNYAEEHMVGFGPSSTLDFGPWPEEPELKDRYSIFPLEPDRIGETFGKPLIITVKYPFNFLVLSSFGLGPITLKAQTIMLME